MAMKALKIGLGLAGMAIFYVFIYTASDRGKIAVIGNTAFRLDTINGKLSVSKLVFSN